MSTVSKKNHEIVLQILFAMDMGLGLENAEKDVSAFLMRELSVTRNTVRSAYQKANLVYEAKDQLDQKISEISEAYALERIHRVEKNILRLALYEIHFEEANSKRMIIAEALRLTRKFSTKEAATYINAILDTEMKSDECASRSPLSSSKEEKA